MEGSTHLDKSRGVSTGLEVCLEPCKVGLGEGRGTPVELGITGLGLCRVAGLRGTVCGLGGIMAGLLAGGCGLGAMGLCLARGIGYDDLLLPAAIAVVDIVPPLIEAAEGDILRCLSGCC